MSSIAVAVMLLCTASSALGHIRLNHLFSDHAVLQQGKSLPVWGRADSGERVTVQFGAATKTVTAAADGTWRVEFPPPVFGATLTLTAAGENGPAVEVKDLLVGEVWLCSGQSNMEFRVKSQPGYVGNVKDMDAEIAAADHPQLRMYLVPRHMTMAPQDDTAGEWLVCSPQTVGKFSAVGYFFGRDLQQSLHRPVGVILASYGGTHAQSWLSRELLEATPMFEPYVEKFLADVTSFTPAVELKDEADLRQFKIDAAAAKATGAKPPVPPRTHDPMRSNSSPFIFYNGMLAPLAPYAIRGFVWYQGESNTQHPQDYAQLQSAIVESWRKLWRDADLPFILTQLPNVNAPATNPQADDGWTAIRAAQAKTAATVPNTAMAVTIELGTSESVHPTNKQDVGRRLALVAEAKVYLQPIEWSGPVLVGSTVEGNRVRLSFSHAAGVRLTAGATNSGFDIAGDDGKPFWATASLDGSAVILSSPNVQHPATVRYDWADNPVASLYNNAGLPAAPFDIQVGEHASAH